MAKMFMKFMLVGISGVGVNMAVYIPVSAWLGDYLVAAVCSFFVAVTSNFFWNMIWTFRGRGQEKSIQRKYVYFFCVSLLNLGLNVLLLKVLVESWHMGAIWAQLLAILSVGGCNFLLNYVFTFGEKKVETRENLAAGDMP